MYDECAQKIKPQINFYILVYRPSTTFDKVVKAEHYDYLKAEKLGEAGEPCKELYKECRQSLMDIFTQVYDSPLYKFD